MHGNEDLSLDIEECGELISTCYVVDLGAGKGVAPIIYLEHPPFIADTKASIYKCDNPFQAATYLRQHGIKRPTIKWLAK